jgi:hypothetical protein
MAVAVNFLWADAEQSLIVPRELPHVPEAPLVGHIGNPRARIRVLLFETL